VTTVIFYSILGAKDFEERGFLEGMIVTVEIRVDRID